MTTDFPALAETPATGPLPCMEIPGWHARYQVLAGLTTADGGCDMGLFGQGVAADVVGRWLQWHGGMRAAFPGLVVGRQVHGTRLSSPRPVAGWAVEDQIDGHIARAPGLLLTVTVADCVPVYLLDRATGAVGLLHAGWRGIAGGIVEAGIAAILGAGSTIADSIVIHCGVSICGTCYEVGPEVASALRGRPSAVHSHIDLREAIAHRAQALGVGEISISSWCTAHDDRFFSHRRSRGAPGRMIAYIGRPAT